MPDLQAIGDPGGPSGKHQRQALSALKSMLGRGHICPASGLHDQGKSGTLRPLHLAHRGRQVLKCVGAGLPEEERETAPDAFLVQIQPPPRFSAPDAASHRLWERG